VTELVTRRGADGEAACERADSTGATPDTLVRLEEFGSRKK
jgi:hypothetical protein